MQALRKIVESENDEVVVKLPPEFLKRKLEVLIFPLDDEQPNVIGFSSFLEDPYSIPGFTMPNREERNAR